MTTLKRFLVVCAVLKILAGVLGFLSSGGLGVVAVNAYAPRWAFVAIAAFFGVAGGSLLVARRREESPANLGAFYLVIAASFSTNGLAQLALAPSPIASLCGRVLRDLPLDAFAPWLLWLFVTAFPRSSPWELAARWCRALCRIALAAGAALFAANVLAAFLPGILHSPVAPLISFAGRDGGTYWIVTYGLLIPALPLLLVKSSRAPADEKRRVYGFVLGLVMGVAPLFLDGLLEALVPSYARLLSQPGARRAAAWVVYPLIMSIPVTTAYAVIAHRALDIRPVVRRALQYALGRYTIIALTLAPLILWVAYIYLHRDQRIADMARGGNAMALLAVIACGAAALVVRRPLLAALDKRFFRESSHSGEVLAGLIETQLGARSPKELAERVAGELDRVMHLDSVAMLILNPGTAYLESPGGGVRSLSASSPLGEMALSAQEPISLDWEFDDADLVRLSGEDREWLAEGGFHVLTPVRGSAGETLGLLALGEKRSDLPYSKEDLLLLQAVASSAGLAIENHQLRTVAPQVAEGRELQAAGSEDAADSPPAEECVACGLIQDLGLGVCGRCGGAVVMAVVPRILRSKFRFVERVAAGGMGVVYRATDLSLGRSVAVKTLPRTSPRESMRLRREARAIAAVSHPNLATIFGAESWRGTPLLMFEFLDGGTLKTRLQAGPMPAGGVIDLGIVLARVLERIHDAGILHRDIKPGNIGYTADGVPKLLDFGLARLVSRTRWADSGDLSERTRGVDSPPTTETLTASTSNDLHSAWGLVGTIAYLSPEAARGEHPDPSFDLWGLAVVLYEAIAGSNPFQSNNASLILARIESGDVRDIRDLRPGTPAGLGDLLADALSRDRRRRPKNARTFAERLEQIRTGSGSGPDRGSRGKSRFARILENVRARSAPSARSAPAGLAPE